MTDQISTDVLIIGAGAAGIRAALAAYEVGADILLLAKGKVTRSGSTFSELTRGWGLQALVNEERNQQNLETFYDEIIRVGLGKCDPKLVRILVEESGPRFEDLISYGIKFKKNSKGDFLRAKGCFSRHHRAFITDDFNNLKQRFNSLIKERNIKILTATAVELISEKGECWGCWTVTDSLDSIKITAKSTVLTTGGGAGIYRNHLVSSDECGDGYCLAHTAGARHKNLEFIQFMLGLKTDRFPQFMPLSELDRPKALIDSKGCDLLKTHIPDDDLRRKAIKDRQNHFPFSCRDHSCLIDEAVADEIHQGNPVFYGDNGDQASTMVAHFAHAFNGGVEIDETAETTVPGLFAAGEVAAGPHGADRIGGCMMTSTQVFGARAGKYAAIRSKQIQYIPDTKQAPEILCMMNTPHRFNYPINDLTGDAKQSINDNLMVIRKEKNLKQSLNGLEAIQSEFDNWSGIHPEQMEGYLRLRSTLIVGQLIAKAAIHNKTGTGSHFRADTFNRNSKDHS